MAKSSLRRLARPEAHKAIDGRRAPRHKYVQFLWFHCLGGGTSGLARSVDVSGDGLGFVANQEIALNERVFLVLLTPFGRISTVARVMHCVKLLEGSFRMGVHVEIIPPTDKAAWTTLVDKEAP